MIFEKLRETLAFFIKFDINLYSMKSRLAFILLIATFFVTADAFAQVDRRIAPGQYRNLSKNKNKKQEIDFVGETVKYLTKELKLDDFQAAAVREILAAEKDNLMEIAKDEDMRLVEKRDKTKVITDKIDEKIIKILSPEQVEKYKAIQERNSKL